MSGTIDEPVGLTIQLPHGESGFWLINTLNIVEKIGPTGGIATAVYTYTGKEIWKAEDHFPGNPVMPGMMILESMAQTSIQIAQVMPGYEDKIFTFKGISEANFYEMVKPGTTLTIDSLILFTEKDRFGTVSCEAKNGDKPVADAVFKFAVVTNRTARKKT